jgi:urocanate hydratase
MFHLAASAMRSLPVHDLADEHLRALTAATGESAYLLIPSEPRFAVYVRQCESPSSVRYASWLGRAIPLSGTATGAAFRGELAEGGYATARDAIEPDTATAAAPVIDASGEIHAVISVIAPSFRVDDDQLRAIGELVAEHGRALSAQLGAPGEGTGAREAALP